MGDGWDLAVLASADIIRPSGCTHAYSLQVCARVRVPRPSPTRTRLLRAPVCRMESQGRLSYGSSAEETIISCLNQGYELERRRRRFHIRSSEEKAPPCVAWRFRSHVGVPGIGLDIAELTTNPRLRCGVCC
uniref:Uncharacterized protein n=1 Tax=Knipowitschia caucasica TaxID=637954 RepID=A0AAV2KYH0_KNICA